MRYVVCTLVVGLGLGGGLVLSVIMTIIGLVTSIPFLAAWAVVTRRS